MLPGTEWVGKGTRPIDLTLHLESSCSFSAKLKVWLTQQVCKRICSFPSKTKIARSRSTFLRRLVQKVVASAKWLWRTCWTLLVTTQKEPVARNSWEQITAKRTNTVNFPPSNSLYQQAFLQSLFNVIGLFYHSVWLQPSAWATWHIASTHVHLPSSTIFKTL